MFGEGGRRQLQIGWQAEKNRKQNQNFLFPVESDSTFLLTKKMGVNGACTQEPLAHVPIPMKKNGFLNMHFNFCGFVCIQSFI